MSYENIIYEVEEKIARITLNRPETMNALSWQLIGELDTALKQAERDDNVRVIIIKGAGRCFSAGYDLRGPGLTGPRAKEPLDPRTVWNSRAHVQGHIENWFNIWNLWKPVIAQLHGHCLAGACELALICDIVTTSLDCRIGYPPIRFMATGDMAAIFSWLAGLRVAKDISFGRILSGEEAERYGLVNYAFPSDRLEEETTKIAKRIALIHPELLSLSKRVVNRTFDVMGFRVSLEYGGEFDSLSHFGQDYGFRSAVREKGLTQALRDLNAPFGGV